MAFSKTIREDILVAAARHCCVCHKSKGVKIEVHHIIPKEQNGEDTFENAIALCFDCHSDAGHYNPKHPKGTKFSPNELRKHKEAWFRIVREHKIQNSSDTIVALELVTDKSVDVFQPVFVEVTTDYRDVEELKEFDFEFLISKMKSGIIEIDKDYNEMKSVDDLIEFLNKDYYESNSYQFNNDAQPVDYFLNKELRNVRNTNLSVCVINLKLTNYGPDVVEDYKVYLSFENVIKAECVDKRGDFLDTFSYHYNVSFKDDFNAIFNPENRVLVQSDSVELDDISFITSHLISIVYLNWRLVARNFSLTGRIELKINPVIEIEENLKFVKNPLDYTPTKKVYPKLKSEYV